MNCAAPFSLLQWVVILVLAAGSVLQAQVPVPASTSNLTPHFPTNEDLRHLKAVSEPQLSPDGRQVLFTVTDATADGARSHLWLATVGRTGAKAEETRQITLSPAADKRGEFDGQWSPDGAAIFFLAKRGEHTQLFRLDMRGGEASPYDLKIAPPVDDSKGIDAIPPRKTETATEAEDKDALLPVDVSGYGFSADGKWLAVWARDPETPGEKKQKEAKADASWVHHETHRTRLYLAALKAEGWLDGALRPVAVTPNVQAAAWSPTQDRLVVVTEAPDGASDLGPARAAWLVDADAPGKPVKLEGVPATVGRAIAWRPDGKEIVFGAQTPEDAPPGYDELFALAIGEDGRAPGPARRLAPGLAGQLNPASAAYAEDGRLIALAGVGTRIEPLRIDLKGKAAPAAFELGTAVVSGLNTNRGRSGWVWLDESGGKPVEMCFARRLGEGCSRLPLPELAPAGLRFVAPKLIHWPAAMGAPFTIDGLLYLPEAGPGGAPAKIPLIVDVHGGPFGAWEDRNDAYAAFLVGQGWAVLRPNPRGSSNYGVRFAAANKNDLGGGDAADIMAGVDYALAHYPLDPARLALMGYSYGGEMAAFVEVKTDRFKAIVSGAPVIDQFSEYGTENDSWYDRWYFGKPWEHLEDAWRQSPLSGAAKARTPLLLLQGQSDMTDPLGQAEEMDRALRQMGVPVELVTYPREDHGPLAMGIFGRPVQEPWHSFDARQRMVAFIGKAFGEAGSAKTAER